MVKISGNTFVVSGGASGLGGGVIKVFLEEGANLGILDLNVEASEALAKEHPGHIFYPGQVDVTDEAQVNEAISQISNKFSGLKGAILCAGIMSIGVTAGLPEESAPYGLQGIESLRKLLNVNILGTFNVAQQVAQRIIEDGKLETGEEDERGVILLTSSYVATDGQSGSVAYTATKGAISSMVLPMARDLARYGIRVNAVAPGVFLTPINSMFISNNSKCGEFPVRPGRPDEFGRFVKHIFDNEMINGVVLRQDGALRGAIDPGV
ncbi:3-hydroxy-2-methylbutyryl-CoA dehydrogenase [Mycena galericulata]|nr:3-hydroxy-2-methylbutyryl-CoA dehydrogenase [Mycena galericulata]